MPLPTVTVIWTDHSYARHERSFRLKKLEPAEAHVARARKFVASLERKDKASPGGLYRSIRIA